MLLHPPPVLEEGEVGAALHDGLVRRVLRAAGTLEVERPERVAGDTQEGAERRSSAKKAAIPDSRSMPALPRLGRPGSVPPGRSSAPMVAGDSPDSD